MYFTILHKKKITIGCNAFFKALHPFALVTIFSIVCLLNATTPKEHLFIEKYTAPSTLQKILDPLFTSVDQKITDVFNGNCNVSSKNEIEGALESNGFTVYTLSGKLKTTCFLVSKMVLTHPSLPLFFIKIGCNPEAPQQNIMRLIILDKIHELIDDPVNKITTVEKIEKWLYHRPNRPHDLTDMNYLVLSKKVDGSPYKKAPPQNKALAEKINRDASIIINIINNQQNNNTRRLTFPIYTNNILATPRSTIAFIDTELETNPQKLKILWDLFFAHETPKKQTSSKNITKYYIAKSLNKDI